MKKIKWFAVIVILAIIGFCSSGCALKAQGYGIMPSKVKSIPYNQPQKISALQNNASEQKMDKMIDGLNNLASAINKKSMILISQNVGKKPEVGAFNKKIVSIKKTNLEKRVLALEWKVREQNKSLIIHGLKILQNTEKGDWRIDRIGTFLSGSTELKCSKKGCDMRKQIRDMVVQYERDDYKLVKVIGFTNDDGDKNNQERSLARAQSVFNHIVSLRKDYEKTVVITGGGPTRMFGVGNENLCVICYWQKI